MNRKAKSALLMIASFFLFSESAAARDFYFPKNSNWLHFHALETGDIYEDEEDVLRGEYDLSAEFISSINDGVTYLETLLRSGAADGAVLPILMLTKDEPDDNASAISNVIEEGTFAGRTALAARIINGYTDPEYDFLALVTIDKPSLAGWDCGPVYSLTENGMASALTSTFPHELFHALGMISLANSQNGTSSFNEIVLTDWDLHLRDIYHNAPLLGQKIITEDEICPDDSCFVTLSKNGYNTPTIWGGVYFTGNNVEEVLAGATILPPTHEGHQIAVPGLPINTWEWNRDENGELFYNTEFSHIELQNSLMSHQNYRNWGIFMEAELAVLQDLGYTLDRRDFYGFSIYGNGLTVNNGNPFFARENGAYITGKPSTTPWGIGLHVYGSSNTVTQSADLLADGFSGIGIRVDGSQNTLTIAPGTKVTANGEHGYGVLFTYGKEHNLVLRGSVEAAGNRGRAVAFNFGDNYLGNYVEYRGSYIRIDENGFFSLLPELEGALMSSADITGTVTGSDAAVYIGPSAYVENINIMRGAAIKGSIVSDWSPVTFEEIIQHPSPATLTTALTFGYMPDENGVKTAAPDPAFNSTIDGNISGSESLDMTLYGGKLTVTGVIDVRSLTTDVNTVLSLKVSNTAKTESIVRADTIDIAGTLSYTFDPALYGLNTGDVLSVLNAGDTLTWTETDESFSLDSIFDYYKFDYVYDQASGTLGLKVSSAQSKTAGAQTSNTMTTSVISAVGNKIMGRLSGGISSVKGQSGGDMFKETGLWGKALYTHAHKSGDNAFKADIYGGVIGSDGKASDALTLGAALAWSKTNGKSGRTDADAETYAGYLYGKYEQTNGWTYNLATGYGVSRFDVDNAPKFNVKFANAQGYADYDLGKGFVAEGGARYVFTRQNEYTAGTTTFKAKDTDTLTGVLGGRYAYESGRFGVQANLAAIYDLISDKATVRATGRGTTMFVNGERLHRFGGEAGVSATIRTKAWTVELGYDAQVRKDYNDQTVSLKAGYRF